MNKRQRKIMQAIERSQTDYDGYRIDAYLKQEFNTVCDKEFLTKSEVIRFFYAKLTHDDAFKDELCSELRGLKKKWRQLQSKTTDTK